MVEVVQEGIAMGLLAMKQIQVLAPQVRSLLSATMATSATADVHAIPSTRLAISDRASMILENILVPAPMASST